MAIKSEVCIGSGDVIGIDRCGRAIRDDLRTYLLDKSGKTRVLIMHGNRIANPLLIDGEPLPIKEAVWEVLSPVYWQDTEENGLSGFTPAENYSTIKITLAFTQNPDPDLIRVLEECGCKVQYEKHMCWECEKPLHRVAKGRYECNC